MIEIEASDIQLFILIPMLIDDDYYRLLDPDETCDQEYIDNIVDRDPAINLRTIPEIYEPLFLTEDFKAVFRPSAINLAHVNPEQTVQAIVPRMNFVVRFKWRVELMCNLALLILEIHTPTYTSISQLNDLLDIVQHDSFLWETDSGWLLPHRSITQMLDVPPNQVLSLADIVGAFETLLGVRTIINARNPMVALWLQMDIKGGEDFYDAINDFGEYLLQNRYLYLSSLLAYHENQNAFIGNNWRCSQNLDTGSWFEWHLPQHRDASLTQHRHAASNIYTSSMHRRRAARRIFKICTMDFVVSRLMAHLLASKGEARRLRNAIHRFCRDKDRSSALYHDILYKLARLESRFVLLNTNITNPDWVLDNPFGEGAHFIDLMRYIQQAYGTLAHVRALRQQLDLFNQMLDRCL